MSTTETQVQTTQIKHWVSGELLYEGPGALKEVLEAAVSAGADLSGAYLREADLREADLSEADLDGAYLRGAYLREADLREADLSGADLRGADLSEADLRGADLSEADLDGAYLRGADLRGAYLSDGTVLAPGVIWREYRTEVLPWLLAAGGRTLESFRAVGALACHDWDNCLMAHGFGVHSLEGVPAPYRPWAELTIQLFDARLLDGVLEELIPATPAPQGAEGEV
jgi:uncharacterized protein YjbI with pentapeptide repeats